MRIPPIPEPHRYVGLYAFDFGTHVSVGYTANEVGILLASAEHSDGIAYEIYRVSEAGGFELRGVWGNRLTAWEAIAFLRGEETAAREDFDTIKSVAAGQPAPCRVDLYREKLDSFTPPYATVLTYPVAASAVLSDWLARHIGDLGDHVAGGSDVMDALHRAAPVVVACCTLPTIMDYTDRPESVVLGTFEDPIQRR